MDEKQLYGAFRGTKMQNLSWKNLDSERERKKEIKEKQNLFW